MYACRHIVVYQGVLYGMAYIFYHTALSFFSRNEQWLQTASHEATHAIVGMMFFHKIHFLQANENHGAIYQSGKKVGVLISLAPYCYLPMYSCCYALWALTKCFMFLIYLFIGFTLAFHLVCFCSQTRLYQSDIQTYGYIKSFLFLFVAWFFNATIILLSVRKGIVGAITYIFPKYWNDITDWWNFIF